MVAKMGVLVNVRVDCRMVLAANICSDTAKKIYVYAVEPMDDGSFLNALDDAE